MINRVPDQLFKCLRFDRSYHTHCCWKLRWHHAGQHHVYASVFHGWIMHQNVLFCYAIFTKFNHLQVGTSQHNTFVSFFPEYHRLSGFQEQLVIIFRFSRCNQCMNLVVKYDTIFKYLNNRSAFVPGRFCKNLRQVASDQ